LHFFSFSLFFFVLSFLFRFSVFFFVLYFLQRTGKSVPTLGDSVALKMREVPIVEFGTRDAVREAVGG
jgi:hypothetical protein